VLSRRRIIYTIGREAAYASLRGWVPKLQLDSGAEKDLTQSSQREESTEDTESFETAQCAASYLRDAALVPADLVARVLFVYKLFQNPS
jgi:hypothetical protein